MLQTFKNGQGSIILRVKLLDSSATTGAGLTGLTSASSGLRISTIADNESAAVAYTVAGSTIEAITTLGTYAAPTATKCRFKELDATNHPGVYELQFANARFAVSSAKSLLVSLSGAANLAQADFVVQLQSDDPYVAKPANSSLLSIDGSGRVDVAKIAGTAQTARDIGASVLLSSGTGAGQISLSSGLVSLAATQTFNVTGNITGNLTGSVGSVTGAVGSVTGAVGSVTARVTANTDQLAGQTVTAAAGVTFPSSIASPTNITAGTITTVTTVTNLTNAPTAGDLTATMKTSVAASVLNATAASYNTASTIGNKINSAASAGDPWTTALPGAYGAGTAGYILGTNLNATVSSRSSLDASAMRTAVGLASANLDTQLSGIASYIDYEVQAIFDRLGAPAGPSLAADVAAIKAETAAIVDDTGTSGVVLTSGARAAIVSAVLTTAVTESYRNDGSAPTLAQALCELLAHMGEASISGTTKTIKKFDGSTTAASFTLNDATSPASVTRAS